MFECIVCGPMDGMEWDNTSICFSCYIKKLKEKNRELEGYLRETLRQVTEDDKDNISIGLALILGEINSLKL